MARITSLKREPEALQAQAMVDFVRRRFRALANARKAREMAAYMKTDMPFYGIQKPDRVPVLRALDRRFPIESRAAYTAAVKALWSQPHREEKYAAIHVAQRWPRFITFAAVPLYRRLIVEGAWWDLVDDVAARLVGAVVLRERDKAGPLMDQWIDDRDLWIRRAALLSHLSHKAETNEAQLFDHCLRRAHEKEFFIRKAIGWVLREYGKTAPRSVRAFLRAHGDAFAPLSRHEAGRRLE